MRIAVTSQNFRSVTGHAGKARRFLIYVADTNAAIRADELLDLPPYMAMHGFEERAPHPLDAVDVLITAGCGDGFVRRMAQRGVRVVATAESDPEVAVHAFLAGCLKPPAPHCHDGHAEHGAHADAHACACHA